MDAKSLIEALSDPRAWRLVEPGPTEHVEVRQTHISLVFLVGAHAYKVKKPLDLGFLDFTTLARRRHFCAEEVRLNRRLAPSVYQGVVPIARGPDGIAAGAAGEALEYAVCMERLDDDCSLRSLLARGALGADLVVDVARRVAAFHVRAERSEEIARGGRFEAVAGNCRENFAQTRAHVGQTVSPSVFARTSVLTEEALARVQPLVEERAARLVPCDGHGDLHLDHVYSLPGRRPPDDLPIIDCIEFNTRFRHADPVADAAFLVMDLAFRGRPDLARLHAEAYLDAAGDAQGSALLPLYVAYRSLVRAKVNGIALGEAEIPDAERTSLLDRARGHWLFALGELEVPARRPALVLVGGLPGTGKSTLARALAGAREGGFVVIAADLVRKELVGLAPTAPAAAPFGAGIYTPAWNERTYAECLRRAAEVLFAGGRAIVDASFREEGRRRAFLDAARRWGVRAALLVCEADAATVARRLAARRGDPSDADLAVYRRAAAAWEPLGDATRGAVSRVPCGGSAEEAPAVARRALQEAGLL